MKTKRRWSRTTASQQRLKLDPRIWSQLPQENLLDVFDALPVKDHYRLRRVCKHWHNAAKERHRLLPHDIAGVQQPFFVLLSDNLNENGASVDTLALHIASRRWIWKQWWRPNYKLQGDDHLRESYESFEVEGMVFHMILSPTTNHMVFSDVHRNPQLGKLLHHRDVAVGSVLGMMVDVASKAHTLIVGNCARDTLMLDLRSNKWESKPSRLVRTKPPSTSTAPKSCVQLEGKMYLWVDSDEIHVYSPSSDQWSALAAPPRDASDAPEIRGLGHWAGALYAVTKNKQGTLSVWKLNMACKEWSEYAQIPGGLFKHLLKPSVVLSIAASHCNGYLLIHVRSGKRLSSIYHGPLIEPKNLRPRFVLFNIANKRWEKVNTTNLKM